MSVKARWKDGQEPLALPAPEPEQPLPPGVRRVRVEPPPDLHPLVAAFWHAEERQPPPWRRETDDQRTQREFLQKRGCWTG
jgi:hypothetical protein